MEVSNDFTVNANLIKFISLACNSGRDYPSIDKNVAFQISIFDMMTFTKKGVLKSIINDIMKKGFRVILDDIPVHNFAYSNEMHANFSIYWKSFKFTYLILYPRVLYTFRKDFLLYDVMPGHYSNDIINIILSEFYRKTVGVLLLMANRKNRNTPECFIAQLPLDIIKYINNIVKIECQFKYVLDGN